MIILMSLTIVTSASATASDQEQKTTESAYFAGGCFWCMEADFKKRDGVIEVISGYMGGEIKDPSYEQVASGDTQHYEAVRVRYNAEKLDYKDMLATFWANIDPYDDTGQFCDKGPQYRAAIFSKNGEELQAAKASKQAMQSAGITDRDIVTKIHKAGAFYRAEKYHQDYYKKNTIRYKFYRYNCGRDERLNEVWGDADIKAILD